jgi:adenine C2-methylase RlmN of 23S rRNA A2503 and tRNA A37
MKLTINSEKRKKSNLVLKSIWEPELILEFLSQYQAMKLWHWLIKNSKNISSLAEVPLRQWSIREKMIDKIVNEFVLFSTKIHHQYNSNRGDTVKLIIELQDGHKVETVIMQHAKRNTVCVSSQVGCQMGCKFCATGFNSRIIYRMILLIQIIC